MKTAKEDQPNPKSPQPAESDITDPSTLRGGPGAQMRAIEKSLSESAPKADEKDAEIARLRADIFALKPAFDIAFDHMRAERTALRARVAVLEGALENIRKEAEFVDGDARVAPMAIEAILAHSAEVKP